MFGFQAILNYGEHNRDAKNMLSFQKSLCHFKVVILIDEASDEEKKPEKKKPTTIYILKKS